MARFDIYQNGAPRFEVTLPNDAPLSLGRGPDCGLVLPDPRVSRFHAELRPAEGEGHVLLDSSSNGTLINGEEVDGQRLLHDEDVIEIASYRIFYRIRSARTPARPTLRSKASPTRILEINESRIKSERAWIECKGKKIELSGARQILGSDASADLRIEDPYVSRLHAAIGPVGKDWQIEDLGSTNGTLIDGRRIQQAQVSDGDRISLGSLEISFHLERTEEKLAPSTETSCGALVGKSDPMRRLFSQVARVAPTEISILLHGESGTGKELLAAAIHDQSVRAGKPFIAVNCGAIPENLAESELFGHEKGAFTGALHKKRGLFAEASGGTIFLDEIGDLPPALQVKLLRVLETGEIRPVGSNSAERVDVRIIAATHRDLAALVSQGKFREDLYYRLAVVTLRLPALRDHLEDLPELIRIFLPAGRTVSKAAMKKLTAHPWRGNVRELRNVLERAALLGSGKEITPDDLIFDGISGAPGEGFFARNPDLVGKGLEEIERILITEALQQAGGVQTLAAQKLGIAKSSLYGKLERYGLRELLKEKGKE